MTTILSFTFGTGGAYLCANCKKDEKDHFNGQCPFAPTKYRQVTEQELAEAIRKLSPHDSQDPDT